MMDIVDQTLRDWRRSRFAWGATDCLSSIRSYLISRGLPDGARGIVYSTERHAFSLLAAYGGAHALIRLFKLPEIDPSEAKRGDVVVIDPRDDIERYGIAGLCTGDAIALRTERTVVEIATRFIHVKYAWSLADVRSR